MASSDKPKGRAEKGCGARHLLVAACAECKRLPTQFLIHEIFVSRNSLLLERVGAVGFTVCPFRLPDIVLCN